MKRFFRYIFIFSSLLLCDFFLKQYAHANIPLMSWVYPSYPYGGIAVFQTAIISFSINHVENLGAAWGTFSAYSNLLLYTRMCIISGLIAYLFFFNRDSRKTIPFLLIITGAIGNILDFFIYGHVVDMFHFVFWRYSFPVFNIADSMITIGIALLFLLSFRSQTRQTT